MKPSLKTNRVASISIAGFLALASMFCVACKKQQNDSDAIRTGITQHLASLRSLNLSAMDIDLNSVSVQGSRAHAQVTFRPKNSAPSTGGMQVTYDLEKKDNTWVVTKTGAMGGVVDHPAGNAQGQAPPGSPHGNLPDFRDLLTPAAPDSAAGLPPGHPPVNASPKPDASTVKE